MTTRPLVVYPTKPLESYRLIAEIRRKYWADIWTANKRGVPLVMGLQNEMRSIRAGLGEWSDYGVVPYLSDMQKHPQLAIDACEAWEARGFPADGCSQARCGLGSLFLGWYLNSPVKGQRGPHGEPTGEMMKPDFLLDGIGNCHSVVAKSHLLAHYLGIPEHSMEPPDYLFVLDPESAVQFVADQIYDAIEFLEKVSGKKYNDEAFLEAVNNEWSGWRYWGEICLMQRNIPAPMLGRNQQSLLMCMLLGGPCRSDVVRMMKAVRDELEVRVRDGIAARPYETARLMFYYAPPYYYYNEFMHFPQQYGAMFIGAPNLMGNGLHFNDDGTIEVAQPPADRGITLRTREDGVRSLAEMVVRYASVYLFFTPKKKAELTLRICKEWHADGVIVNLDRSCLGVSTMLLETRHALRDGGIPTMVYEAMNSDPRDVRIEPILEAMATFLEEGLGLSKLEEKKNTAEEEADIPQS